MLVHYLVRLVDQQVSLRIYHLILIHHIQTGLRLRFFFGKIGILKGLLFLKERIFNKKE
jgi:hypothetical protein